jgi:FeS assembly SUF system protein
MEKKEEEVEKDYLHLEAEILKALKTIYDPEIPVNIYDLGLIYEIDVDEFDNVNIKMTLTAPNCPIADTLPFEIKEKVKALEGVNQVNINLVFDPPWGIEMMSDEAKLELGFL